MGEVRVFFAGFFACMAILSFLAATLLLLHHRTEDESPLSAGTAPGVHQFRRLPRMTQLRSKK
jgi:hypothetical protein